MLAVYVGSSLETLSEIGASDLEGEGIPETVAIGAVAGQTYVIAWMCIPPMAKMLGVGIHA